MFLDLPEFGDCRCMCHVWETSLRHEIVQAKQCLTHGGESCKSILKKWCLAAEAFVILCLTVNGGEDWFSSESTT